MSKIKNAMLVKDRIKKLKNIKEKSKSKTEKCDKKIKELRSKCPHMFEYEILEIYEPEFDKKYAKVKKECKCCGVKGKIKIRKQKFKSSNYGGREVGIINNLDLFLPRDVRKRVIKELTKEEETTSILNPFRW